MENKSINIGGDNLGSPIIIEPVGGDVKNEIQNSFNTTEKNVVELAAEIQSLLERLEKLYSPETTSGKMKIATEAIEHINNNPNLAKRILGSLKSGSLSALQQLLNHPAASFTIGALNDWQQNKKS